jgi:O-antigen/teichoic acid export membrane protein
MLVLMVVICVGVLDFSIYGMAFMSAGVGIIVVFMTQYVVKKYIKYTFMEWIMDLMPSILMTAIMSLCVYCIGKFVTLNYIIVLAIQIAAGVFAYCFMATSSKNESFNDIMEIIKNYIKGK